MSDWKARATPVNQSEGRGSWKDRATPVDGPSKAQDSERPAGAAVESAGDVVTLGYAPQIKAGLVEAVHSIPFMPERSKLLAGLTRPLSEVVSGEAFKDLKPLGSYTETRDQSIKDATALKDANPTASKVGTIAGLVAAGAAGGSGATSLLGQGAKGAITAAAMNPGDKEGEISPLQLEQRGKQAAAGGLTALLLGGLGAGAAKIAPKLQSSESKAAQLAMDLGSTGERPMGLSDLLQKAREWGPWALLGGKGVVAKAALKATKKYGPGVVEKLGSIQPNGVTAGIVGGALERRLGGAE